jgi:hypothetical protein
MPSPSLQLLEDYHETPPGDQISDLLEDENRPGAVRSGAV